MKHSGISYFQTIIYSTFLSITCLAQQELEFRLDGIVLPRLETTSVVSPSEGQLIYSLNNKGLRLYNGSSWNALSPWSTTGNDINFIEGRVGIATSSPQAELDVFGRIKGVEVEANNIFTDGFDSGDMLVESPGNTMQAVGYSDHIARIYNRTIDTSITDQTGALAIRIDGSGENILDSRLISFYKGDSVGIGSVLVDYNIISQQNGVTFNSNMGDFAEYLRREKADENIPKGSIVAINQGRITKQIDNPERIMVTSIAPCLVGKVPSKEDEPYFEKVAFIGQIETRIIGKVASGDYIVPSGRNDGTGRGVSIIDMNLEQAKNVVGQAWESNTSENEKYVNVAVGLDHSDIIIEILKSQSNRYKDEIETLNSRLDQMEALMDQVLSDGRSKEPK